MNVLAFGASYSKNSINHTLAVYATQFFSSDEIEILPLYNYQLPVFTASNTQVNHPPQEVLDFIQKVKKSDLVIISLAEHNGSYTAAFKNLFDWASVVNGEIFQGVKVLLLSTSPGARGGQSVMGQALERFPRHGAKIVGSFSFPEFDKNFDKKKGILNASLKSEFEVFIQGLRL
jgi:NAD(P)H-dependent FMN reductase